MRSGLVSAVVAVSVVLGTASAAHAEKWHHKDALSDVNVSRSGAGEGDITKLSVDYTSHKIAIDVKVGEISLVDGPPSVSPAADPLLRLKDANHESWDVSVEEPLGSPPGTVTVSLSHSGQAVACSGLSVTPDVGAATWEVVLPASCIGKPDWVKVGAEIWIRGKLQSTFDDALKDGPSPFSLKPRLGAKVERN